MKFEIYKDEADEIRWRMKAKNGEIIAVCSEGYSDVRDAEHCINIIRTGGVMKIDYLDGIKPA